MFVILPNNHDIAATRFRERRHALDNASLYPSVNVSRAGVRE